LLKALASIVDFLHIFQGLRLSIFKNDDEQSTNFRFSAYFDVFYEKMLTKRQHF